nr:hypothetical protein [Tanacetum cinerariifolium]
IESYRKEETQLEEEQAAKAQNWKLPVCYDDDDDDDEERSNSLKDNIIAGLPPANSWQWDLHSSAVGTPSTGSGNLYCQWELSPSSGNALCILFPTVFTLLNYNNIELQI